MNDYAAAIGAALKRGDKDGAEALAQERDQVLAQQKRRKARRRSRRGMPLPQRGGEQGGQWPGGSSRHRRKARRLARRASSSRRRSSNRRSSSRSCRRSARRPIRTRQRLEASARPGQRMRVASISPQLPGGLGGAGQQPPGQIERIFNEPQPPPPSQPPAAIAGDGRAERLLTRANGPAAICGAARHASATSCCFSASGPRRPEGPPPQQPAGVPQAPYQVAQAQGLPPVVSGQQRGGARSPSMAAVLLRNARTPEEANRIGAALLQSLQPPAPSADRFQIIHDANGNWVRLDKLTGQATPMSAAGSEKAGQTVEVEAGGSKQRSSGTRQTRRYDIPVAAAAALRRRVPQGGPRGRAAAVQ